MTQAQRPVLALGLLVLAIASAGLAVVLPVSRALELRRSIWSGEERLEAVRRAVRDGTGLAEVSVAGLLISGGSTGRAAAELQLKIGAAARSHNAIVRSMQVLTPRRDGVLTEIALEVDLQASTVALRDLVHTLETSVPLLIVDEINIRSSSAAAERRPGQSVLLDIGMKVRGFAAAGERP